MGKGKDWWVEKIRYFMTLELRLPLTNAASRTRPWWELTKTIQHCKMFIILTRAYNGPSSSRKDDAEHLCSSSGSPLTASPEASFQQWRYHRCQIKTGSHYRPDPTPKGVSGDGQEQMVRPHRNRGRSCPSPRPHAEPQLEQSNPSIVCADRSLRPGMMRLCPEHVFSHSGCSQGGSLVLWSLRSFRLSLRWADISWCQPWNELFHFDESRQMKFFGFLPSWQWCQVSKSKCSFRRLKPWIPVDSNSNCKSKIFFCFSRSAATQDLLSQSC